MNRFEELEAYVAVVDHKGFGNAADKLGIAKSMVSRRVSELERRLGVQLLQRTTRRQSVTDAGREFYQRATQLICDMQDSELSVAHGQTAISGRRSSSKNVLDNPSVMNLNSHGKSNAQLKTPGVDFICEIGLLFGCHQFG